MQGKVAANISIRRRVVKMYLFSWGVVTSYYTGWVFCTLQHSPFLVGSKPFTVTCDSNLLLNFAGNSKVTLYLYDHEKLCFFREKFLRKLLTLIFVDAYIYVSFSGAKYRLNISMFPLKVEYYLNYFQLLSHLSQAM